MPATSDLYIFDGECALCSRFVRFIVAKDTAKRFKLATAQSEAGRQIYLSEGLDPDLMETALLRVNGKVYKNLDVFTETLATLSWPWKLAIVLRILPRPASDWIYRRIANNRTRFQRGACPMPTPEIRERLIE